MTANAQKTVPLVSAASRLGVSWARAWRLVLIGELEGVKVGGRWFVSEQSIVAFSTKEASDAAAGE